MANDFQTSFLTGCFSNPVTCLLTYFFFPVPYGQAMEQANISSCIMGALISCVPVLDCFCLAKAREEVREKNNISGSFFGDLIVSMLCPFCTVIQIRGEEGSGMGQSIERV